MVQEQGNANKRGAALLIALMLVSVLSMIAFTLANEVRVSLARAANTKLVDQAVWHGMSAEALARQTMRLLAIVNADRVQLPESWAQEGVVFPLDNGMLSARITDRSTCFNVNQLVSDRGGGEYEANTVGIDHFYQLLGDLGARGASANDLVEGLVEYIVGGRGADANYALGDPPYRAAGALISDLGELSRVAGWDGGTIANLSPFICAWPTSEAVPLNINQFQLKDAPVLAATLGGEVSVEDARRLIENRPAAGYDSVNEFLARIPSDVAIDPLRYPGRIGVSAEVIEIRTRIEIRDVIHEQYSTLRRTAGGDTTLWRRRFEGAW
jgi:general secretion pathway protein K